MFEAHFQTFEDPEGGVALGARLARFREELARRKLTGFVVPRADQQQNEYVPASEERLAWLTGFTGSAGMAVVLTRQAAVFVDGRYTLQAAKQVDRKAWQIEPLADPPPEQWLARHLSAGDRLGFDPWLHTSAAAERLVAPTDGIRSPPRSTRMNPTRRVALSPDRDTRPSASFFMARTPLSSAFWAGAACTLSVGAAARPAPTTASASPL